MAQLYEGFLHTVLTWFQGLFPGMNYWYWFSALCDAPGNSLKYFLNLFPYVAAGCFLGELLKFTSWTKLIYRCLSVNRFGGIVVATVLGIISPLCTYGTVPVLLALYGAGVSIVPLISFLSASAMMNPQLFIMTWGGLGAEIALARLCAVFLFGVAIGGICQLIPESFIVRSSLRSSDTRSVQNRTKEPFTWKKYLTDVGKNLLFVGKMMLLGIFVAVVVDMLPINTLFDAVTASSPVLSVVFAAFAGIPLYACGGGTIPMVSSLLGKGMTKGSALAFLLAGPATRVTSLAAVATVMKKRFLVLYVAVILLFSVLLGVIYPF